MNEIILNLPIFDFLIKVRIKENNKRMYIRRLDDYILITSPKMSNKLIEKTILENEALIKDVYNKTSTKVDNFIHYQGLRYSLKIIEGAHQNKIEIINNIMMVYVKIADEKTITKTIHKFYLEKTKEMLKLIVDKYENIFNEYNITYKVKYMTSRYGSCISSLRSISISSIMAKYDIKYLEYVLSHELAHLKYPNHQQEFHDHLLAHYPMAKIHRMELKKIKFSEKY